MAQRSIALAFAALLAVPVLAAPPPTGAVSAPALPDVTVLTASGTRVPFRQLIANRTVAINFIFTSCPAVCPLMGAAFGKVQSQLGKRNVTLISVSIDPQTDTPERLAQWGHRFGARPGWTLVTGAKPDIDRLLKAFGVYSSSPGTHSPAAFVADTRRGVWRKVDGLASPSAFLGVIDNVLAEPSR